ELGEQGLAADDDELCVVRDVARGSNDVFELAPLHGARRSLRRIAQRSRGSRAPANGDAFLSHAASSESSCRTRATSSGVPERISAQRFHRGALLPPWAIHSPSFRRARASTPRSSSIFAATAACSARLRSRPARSAVVSMAGILAGTLRGSPWCALTQPA